MNQNQILEANVLSFISIGIVVGFISRLWMLKSDVRQYPTLPNGYLIHITTAFIAASMGAVAYPALRSKNYIAVTFLATAIQQFRDIRKMERESLETLEGDNYSPRGEAYIDGIAKTFEARNYIVIIVSLATTLSAFILDKYMDNTVTTSICIIPLGFLLAYLLKAYTKGYSIGDIATIEEVPLEFRDEHNLYAGDIFVMNVGIARAREKIMTNGIGLILTPKDNNGNERVILNHKGQRTAIIHECSRLLGLERYAANRRDLRMGSGRVALVLVPIIRDAEKLKSIVLNVPILETVRKINQRDE